ncbi:hypothetical protein M3194_15035 [Paenibacillus glycanilyticus]|uniref:hypothetical protein n=1 Tax=Paenibacillus glycanilyticus TaxID=126569 RepID=UPI00203D3949|nr:hypothetical protein [Paenibacillus glycanilyticus]MCM3628676.1 hypothetical protein [Paenibacillus glycanilyticus]
MDRKKIKKMISVITITLLVSIGVLLYNFTDEEAKVPDEYVVFGSNQNLNEELRFALVKRLDVNNIPYEIDNEGNVKIPKNAVEKAVGCCT